MLGDDKPLRETDDTYASAAQDRFEEILGKIIALGGVVTLDETMPLHDDFNNEIVEIGERRVVEFNIKAMKTDFQMIQQIKNYRMGGAGQHKHLEKAARPMVELKLKRKPETEDQWVGVDMEDLF